MYLVNVVRNIRKKHLGSTKQKKKRKEKIRQKQIRFYIIFNFCRNLKILERIRKKQNLNLIKLEKKI